MRTKLICFFSLLLFSSAIAQVESLWDAARAGNAAEIEKILGTGVDVNATNRYGATALGFAADRGHLDAVKALLKHGANPNLVDTFYNITPLLWAASEGDFEIVRVMVESGGDVSIPAALGWAVYGGNPDIVRYLIEKGAPNPKPFLLRAITGADTSMALAIMAANKLNADELTEALIAAKQNDLTAIADKLIDMGADPSASAEIAAEDAAPVEDADEELQLTAISDLLKSDAGRSVENPQNWTAFRGNGSSGVADGQFPPTVWNAGEGLNLAWKIRIPGLAHASPIVWEDKIFIATAISGDTTAEYRVGLYGDVDYVNDATNHAWKLFCLGRTDGRLLWEKTAFTGVPRVKRHTKATQTNATPVTDGEHMVVLFGSEGLVCYGLNGEVHWQIDLGILDSGWFFDDEVQWGHSSSPIIYKNKVIVLVDRSKDSFLAAFDLDSGKEVWRTHRDGNPSFSTPNVISSETGDELVINASPFVQAYNPDSGKELWRHAMNSEIAIGTPVFDNGLIYVTCGYRPTQPILAIRPGGSGDITLPDSLDSSEHVVWRHMKGGTYIPTPIAYQGYFYTLSTNGIVICYDGKTGERKYRARVAGRGGYAFSASPVAADGKLYFASERGDVFVLRAGPEYELIAKNPVDEILMATPAIANGMIYIRGQHHLFAFGSQLSGSD